MSTFKSQVLDKVSEDAQRHYRLWCFIADQMSTARNEYESEIDLLNSKSQLERAINDLDERLKKYHLKWQAFAEQVIYEDADPSGADEDRQNAGGEARRTLQLLETKLEQKKVADKTNDADIRSLHRVPIKMPTIQLPIFEGKRCEWENF